MMDLSLVLWSVVAAGGALYAIGARHLMRGVLGLAVFFLSLTALFALLGAWYLAIGQLFLFVGGVVTMFVLAFNTAKTDIHPGKGVGATLMALAVLGTMTLFLPGNVASVKAQTVTGFAAAFFGYGWIINIAFLLLLAAVIGAQHFLEDRMEHQAAHGTEGKR
jgi:NADH:ubiquinone oxidoreductase subunit 6 (subunit J)